MKKFIGWIILIIFLVGMDQWMKIWIKTNMIEGEQVSVLGNWFYLYFIENPGAAFGLFKNQIWFKPVLSVLRIIILGLIIWFFLRFQKYNRCPIGVKICFALILAGAIGNIIDSIFYGILFSESYPNVAIFLPEQGGYAPLLYGKVVDMFYFPIIKTTFPSWVPFLGGQYFEFFKPIFNFADSYITISMFLLLIFYRKWFKKIQSKKSIPIE